MNQKSLPFLLAFLVLLVGLYLFFVKDKDSKPEQAFPQSPLLLDLSGYSPDVLIIQNHRDKSKFYKIVIRGAYWYCEDPVKDEFSPGLMRSIMGRLRTARKDLFYAKDKIPENGLVQTGLDNPRGTVTVRAGDKEVRFDIGDEGYARTSVNAGRQTVGGTVFIRLNGDVYTVEQGIDEILDHTLDDLRNKQLFLMARADILEVLIESTDFDPKKPRILIKYDRRRGFMLHEPYKAVMNRAVLGAWMSALLAIRADLFYPLEHREKLPDEKPWMMVRFTGRGTQEVVRLYRDTSGNVFAEKEGRPVLMLVDEKTFQHIADTPAARLISSFIWPFTLNTCKRLQIEVKRTRDSLMSIANLAPQPGFKIVHPAQLAANPKAITELFFWLERCLVEDVLAGADAKEAAKALAVPDVVVTVYPQSSTRDETFRISFKKAPSGPSGNYYFARRMDDKLIFIIAAEPVEKIQAPWWHFAERVAFRILQQQPVRSIHVQSGDKELWGELTQKGWVVDGQFSEAMDEAMDEAFDKLRRLPAKRVVGVDRPGAEDSPLAGAVVLGSFTLYNKMRRDVPKAKKHGVVTLYRGKDKAVFAKNDSSELVYLLTANIVADLEKVLPR